MSVILCKCTCSENCKGCGVWENGILSEGENHELILQGIYFEVLKRRKQKGLWRPACSWKDILRRGSENALNLSDFSVVLQRLLDEARINIQLSCDFHKLWLYCFSLGQCCSYNCYNDKCMRRNGTAYIAVPAKGQITHKLYCEVLHLQWCVCEKKGIFISWDSWNHKISILFYCSTRCLLQLKMNVASLLSCSFGFYTKASFAKRRNSNDVQICRVE